MSECRELWQEDGYLHLPGVLPVEQVEALRTKAETIYRWWHHESSPDAEPGGFGPGPTEWILLHLNHPRYAKLVPDWLPLLLNTIALPRVQQLLEEIFQEPGVMVQANLYMNPEETRIGNWHRDCQFFTGMQEEQLAAQKQAVAEEADPPRELHMHIPLVPTQATEMVPGSHRRWDTDEEAEVRFHNAEKGIMPGGKSICLEPGDLAFFHVNSIHRGVYLRDVPRRTIAVTFGRPSFPRVPTAESMERARGYVATYQPWFRWPGYLDGVSAEALPMYERLVDLYGDAWDPAFVEGLTPDRQHYFQAT